MSSGLSQLERAVALWSRFRTPAKLLNGVRSGGLTDLDAWFFDQPAPDQRSMLEAAEELHGRGIDAVLLGEPGYPESLGPLRSAPAVLFVKGNQHLLNRTSVGMCGSRNVSESGLRAARACGEEVASRGLAIVSGYAKGVDTETHLAALENGGDTVIVLAEGILHFRKKRAFSSSGLPLDRVVAISQFPPAQRWNVGAAMTRNGVIAGLSKALVVVEAGETGGTLNAGLQAIKMGRPVLALDFASAETPPGNRLLFEHGAIPVHTRQHLGRTLDQIDPPEARPNQLRLI